MNSEKHQPDAHLFRAARMHADREALRLFAWASAIYPRDDSVLSLLMEQVLDSGLIFAINARKVLELSKADKADDAQIIACRWPNRLNDGLEIEDSFIRALNGIIHSHENKPHFAASSQKIFADSKLDDVVLLHFVIKTDRYPKVYIDIFGMAWTFLSIIGPAADKRFFSGQR